MEILYIIEIATIITIIIKLTRRYFIPFFILKPSAKPNVAKLIGKPMQMAYELIKSSPIDKQKIAIDSITSKRLPVFLPVEKLVV